MSKTCIIIVVGETYGVADKSTLVSHIKNGLTSIPHFDNLKINKILGYVDDLASLSHFVPEHLEKPKKNGYNFSSPEMDVVLLSNTTMEDVLEELDRAINLLPQQVALVYAGVICQSSGHWVLSDTILKPDVIVERITSLSCKLFQSLADTTKESMPSIGLHFACLSLPLGGEWRHISESNLPATIAGRPLRVTVNRLHAPTKKVSSAGSTKPELAPLPSDISGVEVFCRRLEEVMLTPVPPPICQPAAKANGCSIHIHRPCLYMFPEGSGQSTIFALPGFSLMVNAGSSRYPKCWRMAQHLENIDAILHTHWGIENTIGLTSLLPALMASDSASALPNVSCLLTPPPGHLISQPQVPPSAPVSPDPLVVNIAKEISDLALAMKPFIADSRLSVLEVNRGAKMTAVPKPVVLYFKAGYGSLELYPLTPTEEDQLDIKKLAELWTKLAPNVASFAATAKSPTTAVKRAVLPLVSQLSVSALLLWKPTRKSDRLLRILFVAPNAHQLRVLTALEALHVGLSCIHLADPLATSTNTGSTGVGMVRKAAPNRPATTMHRDVPHSPRSAAITKTQARPEHKSTSASTNSSFPLKTKDGLKEERMKDKKKPELGAESAPPVGLSPEVKLVFPKPMSTDTLNGNDGEEESYNKLANDENLLKDDRQASLEQETGSLDPLEDWGQPQAMPAPSSGLAKGVVKQVGAKSASPALVRPEGYYEVSLGASKSLYDKLAKRTHVDVAFLPGGGDVSLVDAEFFKRVLARYYVATTVAPTANLLKAILVGKEAWNGGKALTGGNNQEVSLILAHDTPAFLEWASLNEKRLTDNKIDLLTVAERSTIQLVMAENAATVDNQDNDLSCPGFRLDF